METPTGPSLADAAETRPMIARQPVYNAQMGVYGYELLFRPSAGDPQRLQSAAATAHVLTSAILGSGLNELVYHRKAIVNVTPAFLDVMSQVQLPPDQLVLDIPDNIRVAPGLVERLRGLKDQGFHLSIGGVEALKEERLLGIADSFRVDVKRIDVALLDRLTKFLRRHRNLALRALKIESLQEYDRYREAGYDLFQGYFLGTPRIHRVRDLEVNRLAIMQLLASVHRGDSTVDELERQIVRDVSLSFKLLKLVNSPFFGVSGEVESIRRAIVLLGRDEIRKLVSLLALSGGGDQPAAMIEIALLRARTCELFGQRLGVPADGFFTVGMFSALDVLMDQPIGRVIAKLPLNDEIKAAILSRKGDMGAALSCALAIERGDWSGIRFADLGEADLSAVCREALQWTNDVAGKL